MVVTDAVEGTIGMGDTALWFHYDMAADVLYIRRAAERATRTTAEETPDGFILLRREEDNLAVGLTVINWWKRFGSGAVPDSGGQGAVH